VRGRASERRDGEQSRHANRGGLAGSIEEECRHSLCLNPSALCNDDARLEGASIAITASGFSALARCLVTDRVTSITPARPARGWLPDIRVDGRVDADE
jgi:hypothetical protein